MDFRTLSAQTGRAILTVDLIVKLYEGKRREDADQTLPEEFG